MKSLDGVRIESFCACDDTSPFALLLSHLDAPLGGEAYGMSVLVGLCENTVTAPDHATDECRLFELNLHPCWRTDARDPSGVLAKSAVVQELVLAPELRRCAGGRGFRTLCRERDEFRRTPTLRSSPDLDFIKGGTFTRRVGGRHGEAHPLRTPWLEVLRVLAVAHFARDWKLRQFCTHLRDALADEIQLILPRRLRAIAPWAALVLHAAEYGENLIVVLRRNGIELVMMTTGAADGEPEHGCADVLDDLIERIESRHFDRGCLLPDLRWRWQRRGDEEAGGGIHAHRISCDLLKEELIVRQVAVQRLDDPITVGPRVFAQRIVFVAPRVGVTDDIEPMLRPTLAIVLRCQQPFDDLFISTRIVVLHKRIYFLRRRRQAREVERDATDEQTAVSLGRFGRAEKCIERIVRESS